MSCVVFAFDSIVFNQKHESPNNFIKVYAQLIKTNLFQLCWSYYNIVIVNTAKNQFTNNLKKPCTKSINSYKTHQRLQKQ